MQLNHHLSFASELGEQEAGARGRSTHRRSSPWAASPVTRESNNESSPVRHIHQPRCSEGTQTLYALRSRPSNCSPSSLAGQMPHTLAMWCRLHRVSQAWTPPRNGSDAMSPTVSTVRETSHARRSRSSACCHNCLRAPFHRSRPLCYQDTP